MEELHLLSEGQEERGAEMSGRQVGPHYGGDAYTVNCLNVTLKQEEQIFKRCNRLGVCCCCKKDRSSSGGQERGDWWAENSWGALEGKPEIGKCQSIW